MNIEYQDIPKNCTYLIYSYQIWLINQLGNQSIKQSIKQSINHSFILSIIQSNNQSIT